MATIKFKGADVPIRISYKQAWFEFRDMGLNLLKVFEDETVISSLLTNEELMVNLLFNYVKPHCGSLEGLIDALDDDPTIMVKFREAFWEAVMGFINPQMRPALSEYIAIIKEELASPGKNLRKALSDSSEEQE